MFLICGAGINSVLMTAPVLGLVGSPSFVSNQRSMAARS